VNITVVVKDVDDLEALIEELRGITGCQPGAVLARDLLAELEAESTAIRLAAYTERNQREAAP